MKSYPLRVALGIDQLVNTILGGNEDETISSRVGRNAVEGKRWALIAEKVINALFEFLGAPPGHCRRCIEYDELEASRFIEPFDHVT